VCNSKAAKSLNSVGLVTRERREIFQNVRSPARSELLAAVNQYPDFETPERE
jgi:hypothetical protein